MLKAIVICVVMLSAVTVSAETGRVTGLPIPRFVSLKAKLSNVRSGPSNQHPVKWVYHKKGYPVKIVAEFEHWRKINDIDGEEGWVHEAMLSGVRSVVIIKNKMSGAFAAKQPANELLLLRKPSYSAMPVARVQIGVVCFLKKCDDGWCEVKCDSAKGWIHKENAWGIMSGD